MRITCPVCNASYDLPEVMLGRRQGVRCARCANDWVPSPSERLPVASPEDAAGSADTASAMACDGPPEPALHVLPSAAAGDEQPSIPGTVLHPDAAAPEHGPHRADVAWRTLPSSATHARAQAAGRAWIGWIGSLVLVCAFGGATLAWRGRVERAWPPSIRVYAALGLTTGR